MNANVSKLLNEQINQEFYSAYLYLDFANYYAAVGLDGFENWYRVQAQEERDHAMLFYQYLQNNGEGVTFEAIAKPEWERGDHMTPLKKALEHEKLVTASIDAIYAAAYEAKDFRAMQMLDWFIKEQGEEEKNAADLITKMELFGGDSKGLYMLNSELKTRVYTAPSLVPPDGYSGLTSYKTEGTSELEQGKGIETVTLMVRRYCWGVHGTRGEALCPACNALLEYARERRDRCLHGKI